MFGGDVLRLYHGDECLTIPAHDVESTQRSELLFHKREFLLQVGANTVHVFRWSSASAGCFWATVCKTVRPMLSDRCLSCLSVLSVCPVCLSVTLVYCGQTAGWIKMPLGTDVDLGPGDIVLDGDLAPQKRGQSSPILAYAL